jgi:hypothetical protein
MPDPELVTVDHLRAVAAGVRDRTVLVLTADSQLQVVSPDVAFTGLFDGIYQQVLCTRAELLETGVRLDAGHRFREGSNAICTREANAINQRLATANPQERT